MALHDDLLQLARHLVDRNPAAPVEADLRRGVSTAYYALYHLLADEAMTQLIQKASLRPRMSRAFSHNVMKAVCQEYVKLTANSAGEYVTATGETVNGLVRNIAAEFVSLQEARHRADYDTGVTILHAEADVEVMRAEVAFIDWDLVRVDASAATFLAELFCRSIPRR